MEIWFYRLYSEAEIHFREMVYKESEKDPL